MLASKATDGNEKLPPHDLTAERAIVGGCALAGLEPDLILQVAANVKPTDFYLPLHREVFAAVSKLAEAGPFDIATLDRKLKKTKHYTEAGGANWLTDIVEETSCATLAPLHATAVADLSRKRWISEQVEQIGRAAMNGQPAAEAFAMLDDIYVRSKSRRGKGALINMADVQTKQVEWLWDGVLPLGKIIMLAGNPGLGKSMSTSDIASRISTGKGWPDGGECPTGDVIILNAEDALDDTIKPRLLAAGADLSRVKALDPFAAGDAITLDRGVHQLAAACEEAENPKLIIIDPVSAFCGRVDSHSNTEVRGMLAPLADLADEFNVAILCVSHLNKGTGAAIYRTMGSLAWVAAAHVAWGIVEDEADPERRLMLPVKNNLAANRGGFAYRIIANEAGPAIVWEAGRVEDDIDRVMNADKGEDTNTAEAIRFIQEVMQEGPTPASHVQKLCKDAGVSWRLVQGIRARAGIVTERQYDHETKRTSGFVWRLA